MSTFEDLLRLASMTIENAESRKENRLVDRPHKHSLYLSSDELEMLKCLIRSLEASGQLPRSVRNHPASVLRWVLRSAYRQQFQPSIEELSGRWDRTDAIRKNLKISKQTINNTVAAVMRDMERPKKEDE